MPLRYINPDANLLRKKMNIATIFKAQTAKKKQNKNKQKYSRGKKLTYTHLFKFSSSKDFLTVCRLLCTQNFSRYNLCTLSLQDNSRSKMLTIPYLGFETFKNYTLLGDTYLSSPCILIKVTMLMFCRS